MDSLVEDVDSVMAALSSHGAGELVNANHVFERLETMSSQQSKAGTELVDMVVHSFLVDLGMRTDGPDLEIIEPQTSNSETAPDVLNKKIYKKVVPTERLEPVEASASLVKVEAVEELPSSLPTPSLSEDVKTVDKLTSALPTPSLFDGAGPNQNMKETEAPGCSRSLLRSNLGSNFEHTKACSNEVRVVDAKTGAIPKTRPHCNPKPEAQQYSQPAKSAPSPKRLSDEPPSEAKKVKMSCEDRPSSRSSDPEWPHLELPDDMLMMMDVAGAVGPVPAKKAQTSVATRVGTLNEMFPEADPQYLWDRCEEIKDEEAFNALIVTMLSNDDYPRVYGATKHRKNASAAAGSERDLLRMSAPSTSSSTSTSTSNHSNGPSTSGLSNGLSKSGLSQGPSTSGSATSTSTDSQASAPNPSTSSSVSSKSAALKPVSSLSEVSKLMISETVEAAPQVPREPWQDQVEFLVQILPDADPSYLEEKARQLFDKEEELKAFVANALESKDYPSRKDWLWRQEQMALQKRYTEEFSIQNFLEVIPDPFTYFADPKRQCSNRNQASMFLRNKYRKLKVVDIAAVFNQNCYNLTRTCRALDNWTGAVMRSRRTQVDYDLTKSEAGKGIDVPFLQEIAFIENEKKIVEYLDDKKKRREERFDEAKRKGELLQCQCCYDDEVLMEDVRTCSEGHVFCLECLQKSSEQRIGDGHTTFPCLADCTSEFNLQTLQEILKPTVFSRLVQRKQAEEVKAAGIEDLVQCPFCDFCNIPPKEDKVFRCLNPDCMKESCRLCKEESHVPLRCDEVEKKTEVEMRTYIENKMTEALVRTCWKCGKKFVKEDGCNKMTCQCGALMCYICRQPVKDYSHFNGQGGDAYDKCPLYSDHHALEAAEVKKIAEQAKKEVLAQQPNASLKHDPTLILPVYQRGALAPDRAPVHDWGGYDDSDDDYADDYDDEHGYYDFDGHWHEFSDNGEEEEDEGEGDGEGEEGEGEREEEEDLEEEEVEEEEEEHAHTSYGWF